MVATGQDARIRSRDLTIVADSRLEPPRNIESCVLQTVGNEICGYAACHPL